MPPIRLMHVLEATVGGTRRHLLDLCLNLPPDRFRQHVVCSVLRDERFLQDVERLRAAGIEVTILPMRREISPLSDWHCMEELRCVIRDWRPQIVHGHSSKGGFLARLAVRNEYRLVPRTLRPRVVYNPHGFAFQMRTSQLKRWLYVALERYAARWTDLLVAVCESQKQLALEHKLLPEERVRVIPNGIRAEDYDVEIDREAYRRELGIPEGAKVVGTVAALVPQKGIGRLVQALQDFWFHEITAYPRKPDPQPPPHLVVVGEGPLRNHLTRLARRLKVGDFVHLIGQRADIPQFLKALDLFALTSHWEGMPYVLLEAGAAGVPVVASDIAGIHDLITHEVTGRLVMDYYPHPAAQEIKSQQDRQFVYRRHLSFELVSGLYDDRTARMGQELQNLIRREYTLERMVAGHIRAYEELVASG